MLTITLDVNEANVVLGALSTQPFNQVADLIQKIRTQAIAQMEEQAPKDPTAEQ